MKECYILVEVWDGFVEFVPNGDPDIFWSIDDAKKGIEKAKENYEKMANVLFGDEDPKYTYTDISIAEDSMSVTFKYNDKPGMTYISKLDQFR